LAHGGEGADPIERIQLEAILPSWHKASADLSLLFSAPACYTCSDHTWSDYTVSTQVALSTPVAALAAVRQLPNAVASFIASQADFRMRGWSAVSVDVTKLRELRLLFDGRPGAP